MVADGKGDGEGAALLVTAGTISVAAGSWAVALIVALVGRGDGIALAVARAGATERVCGSHPVSSTKHRIRMVGSATNFRLKLIVYLTTKPRSATHASLANSFTQYVPAFKPPPLVDSRYAKRLSLVLVRKSSLLRYHSLT